MMSVPVKLEIQTEHKITTPSPSVSSPSTPLPPPPFPPPPLPPPPLQKQRFCFIRAKQDLTIEPPVQGNIRKPARTIFALSFAR